MEVAGDRYFTDMRGWFFFVLVIVHGGVKMPDWEAGGL